ncbi:hypothetical protein [Acidaminococcus fermentans]|uniref:hypothetical protein n=1 Tax=Acidaminococcus fermentans TaxID=905 RepID=UPI003D06C6BD
MKVYYDTEPEKILYQPLPDGTANVYLRKNITQAERSTFNEDKEEKQSVWTADEKNIKTELSKDDVEVNFDQLFLTADFPVPTLEDRVAVLESAIAEVTSNG